MTELHDDTDLRNAFREFADTANPYVRPPGADLAQRDARGRIRRRRLVVTCAAALAILVPVGIVAVAQWRGGAQSLPLPPATEPAVTTPTATSSSTVTATPTTTSTPPSPDGEPTTGPGQLVNTTLTLFWSDPVAESTCGGPRTIAEGSDPVMALSTMNFDVDGDGTAEIVANIFCRLGQVGPMQLVAVRLDGATATVLGTVLATAPTDGQGALETPDGPGVATIRGYAGLADGTVRVDVANKITCCGTPLESAVVQQRGYEWTGSSFQQVAGPTTFVADPSVANLEVTVPTLGFSAPLAGYRSATLSVTVRNRGPQTAADVSVLIVHHLGIARTSDGDWDRCPASPSDLISGLEAYTVCGLGDIGSGQTVTLTLPMRRSAEYEDEESPHFSTRTGYVEVRTGDFYYPPVSFTVNAA